jgi:hypothetical protein
MNYSHSQPDPVRTLQRRAQAARRAGQNTRCACGETRLEALVIGSKPACCAECRRKKKGQTVMDNHHVAGKANSSVTVSIPVNDHRAVLSVAQYDWPRTTLENPEGCPLLAAAGCIRGFIDILSYLIDRLLRSLENSDGNKLLAAGCRLRRFIDTLYHLIDTLLCPIPEMLEDLSGDLAERLGPHWWFNTPLARFARKE